MFTAQFKVIEKAETEFGTRIHLQPVLGEGSPFTDYAQGGNLQVWVKDPASITDLKPGKTYALSLTEVMPAAAQAAS